MTAASYFLITSRNVFGLFFFFFAQSFTDQFPLLTTKRVFWRGILEELLWFIRVSLAGKQKKHKSMKILPVYKLDLIFLQSVTGINKFQGAVRKRSEDLGCQRVSGLSGQPWVH